MTDEAGLFKPLIEEMNDGTVVVVDGYIVYTNPQVTELTGYTQEELKDQPMVNFIVPEDREIVKKRYKMRVAGESPPSTYEISVQHKDGTEVPVEITAAAVEYKGKPATVSIVRDISERREREEQLERQNKRLEDFTRVVSHDLRNPLSVASGRLELAQRECDSDHLDDINDALQRMDTLIEDLLTIAQEGMEVDGVQPVDHGTVAEDAWNAVTTEDASLEIDTTKSIKADRSRLRQLLENLLANAVQHGGSQVTVTIGDLEDGFYVADDGPGIPEEKRSDVFERGYTSKDHGTGFGLSIVKEIANAHGWEIKITESRDGGTRFNITNVDIPDNENRPSSE